MDKKKAIWIWGSLIILFLIMVLIEIDLSEDENQALDDEEIIYLSYEEDINLTSPVTQAALPELSAPELVAPMPIMPVQMGRLSIPSVILNKKSNPISAATIDPFSQEGEVVDGQSQFFLQTTQERVKIEQAKQQQDLAYKIFQGQRFSAVLTHAINSDLPGMVVAETSQDIYGYQSNFPLLPKGTRLIGAYNSRLAVGDERLYIVWQRALTPNGIDVQLGSPATDRLGQSGSSGFVDAHFWQTFGTSSLLSVMAVGASNLSDEQGEFSNQYQQGVTDALMDTSRTILNSRMARKPTIHIPQGEIIHVVVAKDLDFSIIKTQQFTIPIF